MTKLDHFQLCQPVDSTGSSICNNPDNHGKYIEDFECANDPSKRLLKEMRLSFPSGHSSFSAYTLIYLAVKSPLNHSK